MLADELRAVEALMKAGELPPQERRAEYARILGDPPGAAGSRGIPGGKMRNFHVTLAADGYSEVARGPRGEGGGFSITVYLNQQGKSVPALTVTGRASGDELTIAAIPEVHPSLVLCEAPGIVIRTRK